MNKEILFRGKPKTQFDYYCFSQIWEDNCKDGFVHGSLLVKDEKCYICVSALHHTNSCVNNGTTSMIEVIPETVGRLIQYPCYDGMWRTDVKFAGEFFEGDIIGIYRDKNADIDNDCPGSIAIVVDEHCITENGLGYCFPQDTVIAVKVMGNVWDTPELIGKKFADRYKTNFGYGRDKPDGC